MTSTPVKDMSSIMNFVGPKNVPAPNSAGDVSGGFGGAMNRASGRLNEKQTVEAPVNKAPETGQQPKATEQVKTNEAVSPKDEPKNDMQTAEETLNKVEAAGNEAVKAVAEELGISEEEVLAALEAMGLSPISLLEPQNLTDVVLQLTGEDALALVTNEELYTQVNELNREVSEITGQLMEETGLTPEDLTAVLEQAAKPAEEVPEEQPKFNEPVKDVNNKPIVPEEAEKEIKIVIEKNGEVTEVTAKADAKGNVSATKEVSTTPAETVTAEKPEEQTGGQTDNKQQKQSSDHGEQEMAGRSSLLESLLQNKTQTQTVEAPMETMPVLETPDTEQIMRQILDYMKIQLKPEMNQLEMQLHPASLGTINIQIASKEGVITAQFTAQNDVVKAVIEGQLVELKDSMRAQGIKVEAVEVNVQSQSFDSNLWQGKGDNNGGYEPHKRNTRRINLNDLNLEELPEEMTEEEQLATEMMKENGGTVDYTA